MNKKTIFLVISVLVLVIAGGCTKRKCVEADYPTFQSILDSPADGSTVPYGEPVTFDWHHNEPCEPERYKLTIKDTVKDINAWTISDVGESEITEYLNGILGPSKLAGIQGREYEWWVEAVAWNSGGDYGPESEKFTFSYGEICSPSELVPPVLVKPADGSWAESDNNTSITITWSNPSEICAPEGFEYQVAADSGFDHLVLTGDSKFIQKVASIPVPTCTHLYWRVRSTVGESTSAWSNTYDFYYAADDYCWLLNSPGDTVLIKGYVFEDKCTGTLPFESDSNQVLSPCTSSQYGIHGDGIWDNTTNKEPGIGGVLVTLGAYTCPEIGTDEFETLSNGMYYFTPQAPGPICVSVNKNYNPQLENGIWTLPLSNDILTQKNITLDMITEEVNQNFGWDKNEFKTFNYTTELLTTCRQTDNKNSAAIMYIEEGAVIPVVATNPEKTWFLTRFDCFVSTATGEAEEGDLPFYPEQPIPVVDEQTGPGQTDTTEQKPCSSYTGPRSCPSPRCVWIDNTIQGSSYCTESD